MLVVAAVENAAAADRDVLALGPHDPLHHRAARQVEGLVVRQPDVHGVVNPRPEIHHVRIARLRLIRLQRVGEEEQGTIPPVALNRDPERLPRREREAVWILHHWLDSKPCGQDIRPLERLSRRNAHRDFARKIEGGKIILLVEILGLRGVDVYRFAIHFHAVVTGCCLACGRGIRDHPGFGIGTSLDRSQAGKNGHGAVENC